jgi:hypothetical protein
MHGQQNIKPDELFFYKLITGDKDGEQNTLEIFPCYIFSVLYISHISRSPGFTLQDFRLLLFAYLIFD